MGKTYIKTIIREVKQSFGRFFAIFAIVALGVGFLAGLLAATPNMKLSADQYYEDNNMADIFIKSNLGLTQNDFKEVSKIEGIEHIMPAYVTDELMVTNNSDLFTTRIYGLPLESLNRKDSQFINRLELIEGRMPRSNNECLVERSGGYISEIEIGTTLTIVADDDQEDELEDTYNNTTFNVVGIVSNPFYFAMEREPSSKGDGRLGAIMYVNEEAYSLDVYTDFYIRVLSSAALPSFTDEYDNHIKDMVGEIERTGEYMSKIRYKDVIEEASDKLGDAKDEFDDAKKTAYEELDLARKNLQTSQDDIIAAQRDLDFAKDKILDSERELEKEKTAFESHMTMEKAKLEKGEQELNRARQTLLSSQAILGVQEYNIKLKDIVSKESEILVARTLLDSKKAEATTGFNEAEAEINQGKLTINQGELDLRKAKEDLVTGEVNYKKAKKEVKEELDDADFKITEAEEDIEDIKDAKWYVLDRNSNISYASFSANVEKVGAIAKVFPIFFLLVAALVALTTMTRMVDEGRTQIGTLKALGYTNTVIMSKYVIYCGIASLLGSIFGLLTGFKILPVVIWSTYKTLYRLPELITEFSWPFAIASSTLAIASTMGATILAANKALKEKPSTLMLPRAPKAGKRIFLERITFVWSRMKFTYKATARNLIRYKKHFFMTVIGISGCTALIVAGFGIRDSIGDIAHIQFEQILKYNLIIETDNQSKSDKVLESFLSNPDKVQDYMELFKTS